MTCGKPVCLPMYRSQYVRVLACPNAEPCALHTAWARQVRIPSRSTVRGTR